MHYFLRIHNYLGIQETIFKGNSNNNLTNSWGNLIVKLTMDWLETRNINVIKLWESNSSLSSSSHPQSPFKSINPLDIPQIFA